MATENVGLPPASETTKSSIMENQADSTQQPHGQQPSGNEPFCSEYVAKLQQLLTQIQDKKREDQEMLAEYREHLQNVLQGLIECVQSSFEQLEASNNQKYEQVLGEIQATIDHAKDLRRQKENFILTIADLHARVAAVVGQALPAA
eukprot:comp19046_c0_seq1/m.21483 comp19046_c0_seq1/g.21483  ORF comp19046_c0_seq1/g.21483 comp19046_c0_seq1/m.21483 type:complete len:147 (-) comp19046_c0_seq1:25-465(-)